MAAVYSIRVLRAARILVNLSQSEVAKRAGIGRHTLMRLEGGDEAVGIGTVERVHAVLEEAGIEFLPPTSDSGAGLRLRDKNDKSVPAPAIAEPATKQQRKRSKGG